MQKHDITAVARRTAIDRDEYDCHRGRASKAPLFIDYRRIVCEQIRIHRATADELEALLAMSRDVWINEPIVSLMTLMDGQPFAIKMGNTLEALGVFTVSDLLELDPSELKRPGFGLGEASREMVYGLLAAIGFPRKEKPLTENAKKGTIPPCSGIAS